MGVICATLMQRYRCAKEGIPGHSIGRSQTETQVIILHVSLCGAVHAYVKLKS